MPSHRDTVMFSCLQTSKHGGRLGDGGGTEGVLVISVRLRFLHHLRSPVDCTHAVPTLRD